MQSRVGRDLQRYGACGERLVAGTVPVREVEKLNGGMGIEVCMVSSRGKSNGKIWCIPKGGWELDETVEEAACRETLEEAGLEGILEEQALGTFPFESGKNVDPLGSPLRLIAHIFVMHVTEELKVWPESEERQRTWFPIDMAGDQCRHGWMKLAISKAIEQYGWASVQDR